eukprot:TRINITY_DN14241_c0_g1_i1.p1 TRINITY_DN14241_c0_g1~~TRINITY_DN14241_c0_g1_i1.p1  ORF type:complete len:280 (+),score=30.30 TRINITY_DN14241_c0_g1_i1:56-895(+)
MSAQSSPSGGYSLHILTQPPAKTVYQRIIKPFPKVLVKSTSTDTNDLAPTNLHVEAKLCRCDNGEAVDSLLLGVSIVPVTGGMATFAKLKVATTSSQAGTEFMLRFSLKASQGGAFEDVVGCEPIESTSIEILTHTFYLSQHVAEKNERENQTQQLAATLNQTLSLAQSASSSSASLPKVSSSAESDLEDIISIPIHELYHDTSVQILLGMGPQDFETLHRDGSILTIGQLADLRHRNPTAFENLKQGGSLTDIVHLVEVANRLLASAHDKRSKAIRDQ